jgi:hypothetical protein
MLFDADLWVARFIWLQGRDEEASRAFDVLSSQASALPRGRKLARLHLFRGCDLARRELYEDAERELLAAVAALDDYRLGTCLANPDDLLLELIALYDAWGRPEEAERHRREWELTEPAAIARSQPQ